jgi:hypothetical protein
MFYLSHQCERCHNLKYFEQNIEILWKKVCNINFFICLALILIRICLIRPDPDPQH